jgi:hypothetical protein
MLETQELALPDFALPFIVQSDACSQGLGIVLAKKAIPFLISAKP